MLVLNPIEQFRNIGPFQLDEGTVAQNWQDIFVETALDLGSRPQPFGADVESEPVRHDGGQRVRLRRLRLERRLPGLHSSDDLARLLAAGLDLDAVAPSDGGPHLLAEGVAGDGEEAFNAGRQHPDVMTDQLGVGMDVALLARLQPRDTFIGEVAAARHRRARPDARCRVCDVG